MRDGRECERKNLQLNHADGEQVANNRSETLDIYATVAYCIGMTENNTKLKDVTIDGKPAVLHYDDGKLVVKFTTQYNKDNSRLELLPQEVIDMVAMLMPYAAKFAEAKITGITVTDLR